MPRSAMKTVAKKPAAAKAKAAAAKAVARKPAVAAANAAAANAVAKKPAAAARVSHGASGRPRWSATVMARGPARRTFVDDYDGAVAAAEAYVRGEMGIDAVVFEHVASTADAAVHAADTAFWEAAAAADVAAYERDYGTPPPALMVIAPSPFAAPLAAPSRPRPE